MENEHVKSTSSVSSPSGTEYRKGTFAERLLAYLIDAFILFVVELAIFSLLGKNSLVTLIGAVISLLYGIIFLTVKGATPGKMILKLQVLSSKYEKIGVGTAIIREFPGKIVSRLVFNLGFLWVLLDKRRQAWHDKIAHTVVVKLDQSGKPIPLTEDENVTTAQKTAFWVLAILCVLFTLILPLILFSYLFFFRPFQVAGDSMKPSFHNGEQILTRVVAFRSEKLKRGDVVTFIAPIDANKDFIKRIIAQPGDHIFVRDGDVYLNGAKLDESAYLAPDVKTYQGSFLHENEPVTVPDGMYFLLGDNRPYSSDSREWGFVKASDIIGEYLFCYANCSN